MVSRELLQDKQHHQRNDRRHVPGRKQSPAGIRRMSAMYPIEKTAHIDSTGPWGFAERLAGFARSNRSIQKYRGSPGRLEQSASRV